ncbi:MAG: hypothetical protein ACI8PG_001884 [Planctomycetota bacterium]|jgi:hypothetical protein
MMGDAAATESLRSYKDGGSGSQLIAIAYYNWAVGLCGKGELERSETACQNAIDYVPGNIRAWVLWSVIVGELKREEQARQIMAHVRQLVVDERSIPELIEEAERTVGAHLHQRY